MIEILVSLVVIGIGMLGLSGLQIAKLDVQEVMRGVQKLGKREGGAANLLVAGTLQIERNVDCTELTDPNKHKITVGWSVAKLHKDQADNIQLQSMEVCIIP